MGNMRNIYKILAGISSRRGHMGDVNKDGRITAKVTLEKQGLNMVTEFNWFITESEIWLL
jgi:hypothetical protein